VGIQNPGFLPAYTVKLKLQARNRGSRASGYFFGLDIIYSGTLKSN